MATAAVTTAASAQGISSLQPRGGNVVGDIPFDPALDNPGFQLCGGVVQQYYAVSGGYRGGRKRLLQELGASLLPQKAGPEKVGYITIRFVVNCRGETDRFRVLQVDQNYQPTVFDPAFVTAILTFVKALDDWLPGRHQGTPYDYFQYLTFKINDGQVVDILP